MVYLLPVIEDSNILHSVSRVLLPIVGSLSVLVHGGSDCGDGFCTRLHYNVWRWDTLVVDAPKRGTQSNAYFWRLFPFSPEQATI